MSKVFNMVGGGGGPAASIFVTGLSETDTVTATNGSKTLTGKWTQKPNPAYVTLPDGYTQLEYIESTGTQYVKTGISGITANFSAEIDFQFMSYANDKYIFGYFGTDAGQEQWRAGYYMDSLFTGGGFTYSESEPLKRMKATSDKAGTYQTETTCSLFGMYAYNANNPGYGLCNAKLFSCIIRNNGVPIRDFIPAKRNSDSVIGLYDLVNDVFYTNSGTGEFIAGEEIPQTFDGFLIKPIRDFGTWTVTATDGTKTATQDVLVDVITEYEIEMFYKLWLYRDGDECEDVTGGWDISVKSGDSFGLVKNNTNISTTQASNVWGWGSAIPLNGVDLSDYSKLKIEYYIKDSNIPKCGFQFAICNNVDISTWNDFNVSRVAYNALVYNLGTQDFENTNWDKNVDITDGTHIMEQSISDYVGLYKIAFAAVQHSNFNVSKIWLE